MARPLDPRATDAVQEAALALLAERSFAGISMGAIAERAGVGRPALYRRFRNKEELVVAAIARSLPALPAPPAGADAKAHLRMLVEQLQPGDPAGYAGLIGGLMAEHRRHPALIEEFREQVLRPRRALVEAAVEEGRREGTLRADLDPELAVDLLGGAFLIRAFAGLTIDRAWRDRLFEHWWHMAAAPGRA